MTSPNSPIDPAQLDTLDAIADCLAEAFEDGDGELVAAALLAAAAGVTREHLRAALASGEFDLDLTLEIMKVVDLHMSGGRTAND